MKGEGGGIMKFKLVVWEGQMLLFDEGHIVTDIMFGFSPLLSSR